MKNKKLAYVIMHKGFAPLWYGLNSFSQKLLLESAAKTIRDTIMIFYTVYHTMVCVTPTQFQHPR